MAESPIKEVYRVIPPQNVERVVDLLIRAEKMDSVMSQRYALEVFEHVNDIAPIYIPGRSGKPLANMTFNKHTDIWRGSLLIQRINYLIRYKVPEATGMNIKELLGLPRHELQEMVRAVRRLRMMEDSLNRADLKRMDDLENLD